MGSGASAALAKTGDDLTAALQEMKDPLQLNGQDFTFVSARVLEPERMEIYKGTFKDMEGADNVVVIVGEAEGKKKEFIAVSKGESASIVKTTCAITLAEMVPSEGIEYTFKEAPDMWAITPLSREAFLTYRASKFKLWVEMLQKSECEAQLRRMLQAGVVTAVFDDLVFPTPPEMKDLFKVRCEKTGKIMNIPHPVSALRVWNADEGKYDQLDTFLEGAPKEEDKEAAWAEILAMLREMRGEEYINGLLNNDAAEDEADDVCFAHIEVDKKKLQEKHKISDEKYQALLADFKEVDANSSGLISIKEAKEIFEKQGAPISEEEIKEYMGYFDLDGDGKISFDEFLTVLKDD